MITFRQALQSGKFVLTADLSTTGELSTQKFMEISRELHESVDGIQLAANPVDKHLMSPVAQAIMLQREGIDAITGLDCRDRNRIALQSDLLGLRAAGITSVMLGEGRISRQHAGSAKPVFDSSRRELVSMAQTLNEEESGGAESTFLIGTPATVFTPGPQWSAGELGELARAGARFLQTQLVFDIEVLRQYMQVLVDSRLTWSFAVIVTLAPLPSASAARRLLEYDPKALIPDSILDRLEHADDARQEGIDICVESMQAVAEIPGISGIRLMCLEGPEPILTAIQASGLSGEYNP